MRARWRLALPQRLQPGQGQARPRLRRHRPAPGQEHQRGGRDFQGGARRGGACGAGPRTFEPTTTLGPERGSRAARVDLSRRGLVLLAGRAGLGETLDRRPPVRQSRRRRGDRPARGRHHRGHHHRPCPLPRRGRNRAQLDRGLSGQGRSMSARSAGLSMCATCSRAASSAQGEQLRVTAQLIDAGTGAHVWSDSWDRPADDIFAVQTEIAEHVANRLGRLRRPSRNAIAHR